MLLDVSQICGPDKRSAVVAKHIIDDSAAFTARDRKGLHPRWRVLRRILFIEVLTVDSFRVAFERQWPITEVGQNELGDFRIETNDLPFRESGREVDLFDVGNRLFVAVDFDL